MNTGKRVRLDFIGEEHLSDVDEGYQRAINHGEAAMEAGVLGKRVGWLGRNGYHDWRKRGKILVHKRFAPPFMGAPGEDLRDEVAG